MKSLSRTMSSGGRQAVRRSVALTAAGIAAWAVAVPVEAATIYGGPTFSTATKTGYKRPQTVFYEIADSRCDGTAATYFDKIDSGTFLGQRAVRWDTVGVTELGHLGTDDSGYTITHAYDVNGVGTTVGAAARYEGGSVLGYRAVRWDASGTAATELGHLGTSWSGYTEAWAHAINNVGTVAGRAVKHVGGSEKGYRAVRWDASGMAATELGDLGTDIYGQSDARASAINEAGTIVGFADKYVAGTNVGQRAVRWDASATAATELGHLGTDTNGVTNAVAASVNASGTAVGSAYTFEGDAYRGQRAVRWDGTGTVATKLDDLGTDGSGNALSFAYDLNDAGTAVGNADRYENGIYKGSRAVRWDAGGTAATELGNLGTDSSGVTQIAAYSINDTGTTVGTARRYEDGILLGDRAVMWSSDAVAIDLNTLLSAEDAEFWVLSAAYGISESGWVTGIGNFDPDGAGGDAAYARTFLMQIPEPSSLAVVGLIGVALLRRSGRRV